MTNPLTVILRTLHAAPRYPITVDLSTLTGREAADLLAWLTGMGYWCLVGRGQRTGKKRRMLQVVGKA